MSSPHELQVAYEMGFVDLNGEPIQFPHQDTATDIERTAQLVLEATGINDTAELAVVIGAVHALNPPDNSRIKK